MEEERETKSDMRRRDFVTLCLTVMTVATVGFSLWACGNDLTFPGNIPATATNNPTGTATPEADATATDTPDPAEQG